MLATWLVVNGRLLRALSGRGGLRGLAGGLALHACYTVYAPAMIFGTTSVLRWRSARDRPWLAGSFAVFLTALGLCGLAALALAMIETEGLVDFAARFVLSGPPLRFRTRHWPATAGFDPYTGYGRPDVGRLAALVDGATVRIPPEADLSGGRSGFLP